MAENYLQTNAALDVAGSIRHAIRTAQFVREDPQSWKWVALALHSALQGACVCHLTTTAAPVGAVTEPSAGKWLDYLERSHTDPPMKPPKTVLMSLPELLKAVRKPQSAGGPGNTSDVRISDSELAWLRRFHEDIRNQFVHFEPMAWLIEVSGIPELAKLVARIVEDILDIGWAFRRLGSALREQLQRDLRTLAMAEWPA